MDGLFILLYHNIPTRSTLACILLDTLVVSILFYVCAMYELVCAYSVPWSSLKSVIIPPDDIRVRVKTLDRFFMDSIFVPNKLSTRVYIDYFLVLCII